MDEDIPALLESQTIGYFTPGSKFKYSNTGFCLLALVVQQVSGKAYGRFMKDNIFGPLEMKHTFIYDSRHPVASRGMGYTRRGDPSWSPKVKEKHNVQIIPSDQSLTSATKGDGCVYTCTEDYLKWYMALRSNKLVNLQDKLTEIGYLFPGSNGKGYGLGWFFKKIGNSEKYEFTHTGSTCGFSNVVLQVPDRDLLIAYFSNIAGNHAVFEQIQATVKKHSTYQWNINWNKMHELTD